MPSLSADLLCISQLTRADKIVEFWPNQFFIKNLNDRSIIADGLLDPKDRWYKFCDLPQPESKLTTLIA